MVESVEMGLKVDDVHLLGIDDVEHCVGPGGHSLVDRDQHQMLIGDDLPKGRRVEPVDSFVPDLGSVALF